MLDHPRSGTPDGYCDRCLGKGPGGAVPGSQHLGGAGRGQLQGLALGVPAGSLALAVGEGVGVGSEGVEIAEAAES